MKATPYLKKTTIILLKYILLIIAMKGMRVDIREREGKGNWGEQRRKNI